MVYDAGGAEYAAVAASLASDPRPHEVGEG